MRSLLAASFLCTALIGCAHLGPRTVTVDRFDYSTAIADSWKQQTLLNIVKLRYMDLPVFVDVASIVASYSLQTGVSVNGVVSSSRAVQGDYLGVGGQAIFTDRPTITYTPMTGEKFLRGLITPIDPKHIFFMIQSGYGADFILGLTIDGINGLRNRSATASAMREADPEFLRVLELLRDLQAAGAFGMRVEEDKTRGSTAMLFFRRDDVSPDALAKAAEVRQLLNLPPDIQKLALTYSPVRGGENELAVSSRSMLQIMAALSSYLDVPETDLTANRAVRGFEGTREGRQLEPIRIHSGENEPTDAFAAVQYRGHWFWVDDRDWRTKRAFTAVMFFFTLADTGSNDRLPLVTIPAN